MIKFYLPEWDDIVDPNYDFKTDKKSKNYIQDKYSYGARIWNLISPPPIDGVLVSRPVLTKNKRKYSKIIELGIRKFLKLPDSVEIMGDCGAWQYINKEEPDYDPIETLDFYAKIGVDYGVSVDHIAVTRNHRNRIIITYNNAIKSFEVWKKKYKKDFTLLGAVQGITIDDYILFVKKLYKLGYRHIAIGGLAKRKSTFIEYLISYLLKELSSLPESFERIHFLGIARPKLITKFTKLEEKVAHEISFDNATFLRMAWIRSTGNYLTLEGKSYTALRIRKGAPMENILLKKLFEYDENIIDFNEIIELVKDFIRKTGDIKYFPYYYALLKDKPWKRCPCPICSSIGVNVVIFRGNDRNRRRGFHNIWVFRKITEKNQSIKFVTVKELTQVAFVFNQTTYDILPPDLAKLRKIAIITYCTKEKIIDIDTISKILKENNLTVPGFDLEKESKYRKVLKGFIRKAGDMYGGGFRQVKKIAEILRRKGISVDLYIISARYGLLSENDYIIPYEATLSQLSKDAIRRWSRKIGLCNKLIKIINDDSYDIIILNLTKSYFEALYDIHDQIFSNKKIIAVIPGNINYKNSIKARIIKVSGIHNRAYSLRIILDTIIKYLRSKNTSILDFVERNPFLEDTVM